jgi:hypothetical protein
MEERYTYHGGAEVTTLKRVLAQDEKFKATLEIRGL